MEIVKTVPNRATHTSNGKFAPGNIANPRGRPVAPEIQMLRDALARAKEKHGIEFLDHFVNLAYKHKEVAIALAKKLIPDRIQGEGFGDKALLILGGNSEADSERLRATIELLESRISQSRSSIDDNGEAPVDKNDKGTA